MKKIKWFSAILAVAALMTLLPATVFAGIVNNGTLTGDGDYSTVIEMGAKGVIISGTYNNTVTSNGLIAGGTFNGTLDIKDGADFGLRLDLSNLNATELSYTGAEDYTHNDGVYDSGVYTYKDISYLVMPYGAEYSFVLSTDSGYLLPNTISIKKNGTDLEQGTDYSYDSTTGKVTIYSSTINYPMVITASGHQHTFDQQVTSDKYLAISATCEQSARYYYSCVCGEKGAEVFSAGTPLGHKWGEPKWNWSDDYAGATAVFTCQNDASHTHTVNAVVTSKTTDTSGEEGKTVYTAAVEFEGAAYSDEKIVVISATGAAKPANPDKGSNAVAPRTGDGAEPVLWVFSLLIAGTALMGTVVYRQKKKYNR